MKSKMAVAIASTLFVASAAGFMALVPGAIALASESQNIQFLENNFSQSLIIKSGEPIQNTSVLQACDPVKNPQGCSDTNLKNSNRADS